ncbi:MAG: class I SAM-dependent methyltransferase [Rhizomicrobium sp.]|nr:class I SAM-dependent methyltransferase [Rhizomicrobium sp.]
MLDFCELCGRDGLILAYAPEHSTRGISVHLCPACGLVQSLPRIDRAPRAVAAVSCGADWGNVRYGKGFRTAIALDAVKRYGGLGYFTLLDVGSNRGRFLAAVKNSFPAATLVAVEPDERVAEAAAAVAELHSCRIEDIDLEAGRFDIVHSCHTIEHLAHPMRVLKDHARVLKDGGLLILDAPNIAIIGSDDIVEEWFIDKHLYHFSANTLTRMVEAAGFEILEAPDPSDLANLFIVAKKRAAAAAQAQPLAAEPAEADAARDLVDRYRHIRLGNIQALTAVATELNTLATKGIAIWGAGRIFDSLIVHGGFDPSTLSSLIDTHLKAHMAERHGFPLSGPEALAASQPGVVVVMSRGFADEIVAEAKILAPGADVLVFAELLGRAKRPAA